MGNKNLRRLRCLVTAPTMCNLHQPPGAWSDHYLHRFKRVT